MAGPAAPPRSISRSAAGVDQTTGDSVSATNFESVDASALSSALSVTGSSAANTITTGSGNDTIDGGGGADVIDAGDGNDTVTYRGGEAPSTAAPAPTP